MTTIASVFSPTSSIEANTKVHPAGREQNGDGHKNKKAVAAALDLAVAAEKVAADRDALGMTTSGMADKMKDNHDDSTIEVKAKGALHKAATAAVVASTGKSDGGSF